MTSAPIIRDHPGALVTVLVVLVVGTFLSVAIGGAALIVLAALVVDWLLKSAARLHDEHPRLTDAAFTLLAIAAAGGLIALGAWFV